MAKTKKAKIEKRGKTPKQLERHFKGVANHWRIAILMLVAEKPGITVDEISEELHGHFKTISAHTKRLVEAGLLNKKYHAHNVKHTLSPYGKTFVRFINIFSNSQEF